MTDTVTEMNNAESRLLEEGYRFRYWNPYNGFWEQVDRHTKFSLAGSCSAVYISCVEGATIVPPLFYSLLSVSYHETAVPSESNVY